MFGYIDFIGQNGHQGYNMKKQTVAKQTPGGDLTSLRTLQTDL